MSGASDFLDPVEAVQDDISRSKRVIASALDDLSHHHSWLENYHRDERRRAQRLKRQETLQALELKRQRAAWRIRRFVVTSLVAMRATAAFLARNSAAFLDWAAPRAQALTLFALRETSAALSWSWRTGRDLAQKGYEATAAGFAWTVRTSDALGVAFRKRLSAESARLYAEAAIRARPILQPALKRASASWTRTRFRSKRLASTLQTRAADGWSRTRSEAPILTRNAVTAASQAYARLADKAAVISVRGRDQASIAFGWTVRTSDALGVAFRKWASTNAALFYAEAATRAQPTLKRTSASWTRTMHRSKRLGSALQAQLSDTWRRTRSSAPIFARNIAGSVFKAASETWSQAALRTQRILARRDPPHRALIVRQCTALACIEPRRARLPVIRAS